MSEDSSSSIDSDKMEVSINFVESLFQSVNTISNNQNNCQNTVQINSNSNSLKKIPQTVNHKPNKIINTSASQKKITNNKISLKNYKPNNPLKNVLTISTAYTHRKVSSLPFNDASYNNYLNNFSTTNCITLHRAIIENKRERKLYQDQLQLLKNHINKLKQEEEDLNKKLKQVKLKEQAIINHHKEKENLKKTFQSINFNKQIELEEKKKIIQENKIKSKINLKEKRQKYQQDKIKKYLQTKNEKNIINTIIYENNTKKEEYVKKKVKKLKNEREKIINTILTRRENKRENIIIDDTEYDFNETERIKEKVIEEIDRLKNEEKIRIASIKKTKKSLMNDPYIKTIGLYNNNSKKNLSANRSFIRNEKKDLGRVRSVKLNDIREKRSFNYNMYD